MQLPSPRSTATSAAASKIHQQHAYSRVIWTEYLLQPIRHLSVTQGQGHSVLLGVLCQDQTAITAQDGKAAASSTGMMFLQWQVLYADRPFLEPVPSAWHSRRMVLQSYESLEERVITQRHEADSVHNDPSKQQTEQQQQTEFSSNNSLRV